MALLSFGKLQLFFLFFFVAVYFGISLADQQSRTFKVSRSTDLKDATREQEMKKKCWQYTWMGPKNEKENTSISCSFPDLKKVPCSEPLVWTTGSCLDGEYCNLNQPNKTLLKTACNEREPICVPFCYPSTDQVCVKMTYFLRDGTFVNATSFCGQGTLETSDGAIISSGCHKQENVNGYDVEACFCTTDECNDATVPKLSILLCLVTFWIAKNNL